MRRVGWATAAAAAVCLFLLTPTGCYLARGAWEEAKILSRRRPIREMVRDQGTPMDVRTKLQIVLAARQFAKDSVKLKTGDSFTTYSRLDKDTLVLVLSAAYRDELKPYTWWFPIVGRVPYKGYFDFEVARKTAKQMEQDGFDVYLRPSDAFSTLGFFNDPLLNTTLGRDSLELANTVIHEVTHNTFYATGQAVFNESFANFVGARGAAWFYRSRGAETAAAEVDAEWEDEKLLAVFWTALAHTLDSAYKAHPEDRAARLAVRDTVYQNARSRLVHDIGPQLRTISPRYVERVNLDNAALLAHRIYMTDLSIFDSVYDRENRDLRRSIGRLIALAKSKPSDPFQAIRDWLGESQR